MTSLESDKFSASLLVSAKTTTRPTNNRRKMRANPAQQWQLCTTAKTSKRGKAPICGNKTFFFCFLNRTLTLNSTLKKSRLFQTNSLFPPYKRVSSSELSPFVRGVAVIAVYFARIAQKVSFAGKLRFMYTSNAREGEGVKPFGEAFSLFA